ncbi:helix-turn-helix transcriptional regulator [Listeria seeligeri]|uniref:helix-turn-helix transcriptional regulator n=1 Tax=Listeria seeligeri TaxID=1640 RepID=UPI0022EBD681|nr:helix-turn-helix transcriptional regulator [Listeria seeligeri]
MLITLKAARVNCGYTINEAAKLVGVHMQTLSKFEKDSSKMPLSLLKRVAELYHISEDNIFFGNENEFIRTLRKK